MTPVMALKLEAVNGIRVPRITVPATAEGFELVVKVVRQVTAFAGEVARTA